MPSGTSPALTIRLAEAGDSARLAALAGQLGYPATEAQMARRLGGVQRLEGNAVFVAETEGQVAAWIHLRCVPSVMEEAQAEIVGLVVDSAQRGQGIGRRLVEHAALWARGQGCDSLFLRTNTVRKRAHAFYLGLGFRRVKTQLVLWRPV